jgi:hypothetical protein
VCVGRRRGGVFRYYEDVESEGQGFANEEDYACYVECQVCLLPHRSSPSLTSSLFLPLPHILEFANQPP